MPPLLSPANFSNSSSVTTTVVVTTREGECLPHSRTEGSFPSRESGDEPSNLPSSGNSTRAVETRHHRSKYSGTTEPLGSFTPDIERGRGGTRSLRCGG